MRPGGIFTQTKYKYNEPWLSKVALFHQYFLSYCKFLLNQRVCMQFAVLFLSSFSTVMNLLFNNCHFIKLYCIRQQLDFHIMYRAQLLAWGLCSWSSLAHMSLTTPNNVSALLLLLLLPLMTVSSTLYLVKKHLNSVLNSSFRRTPASILKGCFLMLTGMLTCNHFQGQCARFVWSSILFSSDGVWSRVMRHSYFPRVLVKSNFIIRSSQQSLQEQLEILRT